MGKAKGWDTGTLRMVQTLWALGVGTGIIAAAIFYVFPHLLEDGLIRDDILFIAGMGAFGACVAFPSVVMQVLGSVVNAYRTWRGKNGGAE